MDCLPNDIYCGVQLQLIISNSDEGFHSDVLYPAVMSIMIRNGTSAS